MNSIGKKIQLALVGSIAFVSVVSLVFLWLSQINMLKNSEILETMTKEYSIISLSEELVKNYNDAVKNPKSTEHKAAYENTRLNLVSTLEALKTEIEHEESLLLMEGVENTVLQVIGETDKGISEVTNDNFQNSSEHFTAAHKYNEYVLNNTRTLLQKELEYLSKNQEESKRKYQLNVSISMAVFLVVVVFVLYFAHAFSKQITTPLVSLSRFAEEVSKGDFQNRTKQTFTTTNDEIGSLMKSVYAMVDKLMAMISQEKSNNEKIQENNRLIEKNNAELEKMNSYMVGRELKMVQLKKKIQELESQQQSLQ